MEKLLNKRDVEKIAGKKINFIVYDDMSKINSVRELFPNKVNCTLILYRTGPRVGHWVAAKKLKEDILFFDSFAMEPDDQIEYTEYDYRPELSRILYNSKYDIFYNTIKLQDDDSSVCGRYCGLFFKYCTTDPDFFSSILLEYRPNGSNDITPDELVYLLTENI